MHLTIAGLGVREGHQITLEAVKEIRKAGKVLYLSVASKTLDQMLGDLGVQNAENLRPLYRDGVRDVDNYKAILMRVLEICQKHKNVCLLLPGHPRVGVTLLQWLEGMRDVVDLQINVIEGISSFCTMINDLRIDPLERGSVLMDCNRLLTFDYVMETRLDHFLYHICSVGVSETHYSKASKNNRIDLLKIKLLKHFSACHPVHLLCSATLGNSVAERYSATIGTLEKLLPHVHFGTTLHIPAAENSVASPGG